MNSANNNYNTGNTNQSIAPTGRSTLSGGNNKIRIRSEYEDDEIDDDDLIDEEDDLIDDDEDGISPNANIKIGKAPGNNKQGKQGTNKGTNNNNNGLDNELDGEDDLDDDDEDDMDDDMDDLEGELEDYDAEIEGEMEEPSGAFGNVGQGLTGKYKNYMMQYWQNTIDSIERDEHDFKNHQLPLARIKKVMKTDEEVKMISAEAPILFAKGCDIFITELTMRAWIHAEENKRRTLQKSDIAAALQKSDMFDFLIDIVPREEERPKRKNSTGNSLINPMEPSTSNLQDLQSFQSNPNRNESGDEGELNGDEDVVDDDVQQLQNDDQIYGQYQQQGYYQQGFDDNGNEGAYQQQQQQQQNQQIQQQQLQQQYQYQ